MATEAKRKQDILLVDDSQFSLSQAAKALADGYEIVQASSGAEGLAKLAQTEVDLIITDLLMPHISGLAFLGRVREHYPGTKVIVCSADIQDATSAKAKALGAAAFVPKPVDKDELLKVVRLVLAQPKPPSDLAIDPRHIDAFKEIFNIGIGRAARALSKMVYDTVKLSVPRLEIIKPAQLADYVAESFSGDIACILQPFAGTAEGTAYLLLSAKSGLSLVNSLVRQEQAAEGTLGEADRALLIEVANILINALVGSLANSLGADFAVGQASCLIGSPQVIYQGVTLTDFDYVLFLETMFVVPGRQIGGTLIILLGSAGMGTLLKGIDRVF